VSANVNPACRGAEFGFYFFEKRFEGIDSSEDLAVTATFPGDVLPKALRNDGESCIDGGRTAARVVRNSQKIIPL
jgi:hypothetical protein